ncbi:hypothetical protein L3X38_026531 [Prunus dulcis]|uniref:Uncharacterized protein n=1 Tax=Prunus dulcis TaxID=3755 RepID=A0AAD4VL64_PRUDU|nr:hypothetical protein L3X38_026531 [Prunus dulcis]
MSCQIPQSKGGDLKEKNQRTYGQGKGGDLKKAKLVVQFRDTSRSPGLSFSRPTPPQSTTSSSLRQPIRRIAERAQIETNSLSSFPLSDSPIPNILHHRSLQTEKPKLPDVRPVILKASKSRADILIESLKLVIKYTKH